MSSEENPPREARIRDAERSRAAILGAAEELFAEHGFEGVSLGQIATAANLSRGTPSYFFESKALLYQAVLEQVFRDREAATREAFQPLVAWAGARGAESIRGPLAGAVGGYIEFLLRRPAFSKLIQREELSSATRLKRVPRESRAIEEAFAAVRAASRRRGLRRFAVDDAVLLFVSLTFYPVNQRSTFMASLERDLNDPATRSAHVRLVVDQIIHLVGSGNR